MADGTWRMGAGQAGAFVLAAGIALGLMGRDQGAPEALQMATVPPLTADEAGPWLEELVARGPVRTDAAHLTSLRDHPHVVRGWRDAVLADDPSPRMAWALAIFGVDGPWLGLVAQGARQPLDLTAVVLLPRALELVQEDCTGFGRSLAPVCSGSGAEGPITQVDTSLAFYIASDDPYMALWSLEAACGLGPERGARLADWLERGQVQVQAPDLAPARALAVYACTRPLEDALVRLEEAAELEGDLAIAALVELGRLSDPRSVAVLERVAEARSGTGAGVLAGLLARQAGGEDLATDGSRGL